MKTHRWGGALAIISMVLVVVPSARSVALTPTEIRSRVTVLRKTLSVIAADLNLAERRLAAAEASIRAHRSALAEARSRRAVLREAISKRAAELYISADTGPLQMLDGSIDLDVMLDRMSYLERARRGERAMLEEVRALQDRAATESVALRDELKGAWQTRSRLAGKQAELESRLTEMKRLESFLSSVGRYTSRSSRSSGRGIVCPVGGPHIVSNNFGDPRPGGPHTGNDIRAHTGQPAYAVLAGTIVETVYGGWMGIGVILRDLAGNEWWYAHMSSEAVSPGERVAAGEFVGRVGCTGTCYGSHLHFEYHPGGGNPVDPYSILSRAC